MREVEIKRVIELSRVYLYKNLEPSYTSEKIWWVAECPQCGHTVHFNRIGGDGTVIDPCRHYRGRLGEKVMFEEK